MIADPHPDVLRNDNAEALADAVILAVRYAREHAGTTTWLVVPEPFADAVELLEASGRDDRYRHRFRFDRGDVVLKGPRPRAEYGVTLHHAVLATWPMPPLYEDIVRRLSATNGRLIAPAHL